MSKLSRRFLCYTFIIMGLCWGSCVICSLCGISLNAFPLLYVPYMLGGFSPTIASYIVLRKNKKVSGLKQWLKNVFDLKHGVLSYLLVVAFAVVFIAVLCLISKYEKGAPLFSLVFMVPMMLFGGGLEEAGWRYILQPELEKKFGFTVSTLIVSVIWWLWHLPLFYIKGVSQYGADFLAFGINVLGLSFALAAIRKNTNSVWLCVLFHCIINSLQGVYIVKESILGNITAAMAMIIMAYISVCIKRGKKAGSCQG